MYVFSVIFFEHVKHFFSIVLFVNIAEDEIKLPILDISICIDIDIDVIYSILSL